MVVGDVVAVAAAGRITAAGRSRRASSSRRLPASSRRCSRATSTGRSSASSTSGWRAAVVGQDGMPLAATVLASTVSSVAPM